MIYIVHGTNYSKSRKLVVNQCAKVNAEHIIEKEIEEITPRELYELVVSFDLFGKPPFVVIKIPATKIAGAEDFIKIMKKTPEQSVLIILSSKKLGKTNDFLKAAKELRAKVAVNEKLVESNIFSFVDNLFYKNRAATYLELEKLEKEETDPFYIFSMMLYGLRSITNAKFNTDDFQKKAPFFQDKTTRQADHFSENAFVELFDFFYNTDKNLKTGKMDKDVVITYAIEKIMNI